MFKLTPISYCITILSLAISTNSFANEIKINHEVMIKHDIKHDISMPLRYMQAKSNLLAPKKTMKEVLAEENLQEVVGKSLVPLSGFQGIGVGLGNYQVVTEYPDIASSVGMTQFVQWVNYDIAVFDKATGQVAPGFPKPGNSLWAGFGGACEDSNVGRQTVKYDQLAKRWVLTQSAYDDANGPFYQCVAVSTSEDATGTYNRYAFEVDAFIKDARLGLWPGAYYMSFLLSQGPLACALERDKILAGQPAMMQCLPLYPAFTSTILPADLDGEVLPYAGYPEYYIGLNEPFNLLLARFKVDFATPANTTLALFPIPVAQFSKACGATNGSLCAIQPNTTNKLNVLSDRMMSKLPYRQFRDYGSMVATHTVTGVPNKFAPAVRWYEFRLYPNNPNQNPIVYQQATIAPDSKNRFMGGIAIDRYTNIALGYTVSSSLIYPSIELAYHNYNAQHNQMTIQPLVTGRGSLVNDSNNWGLKSSMTVDPVDECTFYYSNAYLKETGSFNWSTYISKFKLAACQ